MTDRKLTPRLEAFLSARAAERGISIDDLLAEPQEATVDVLAAFRRAAGESGISLGEAFGAELQRIRATKYPTPDCFIPNEIEAFAGENVSNSSRLSHAETCDTCKALLILARRGPSPDFEDAIRDIVFMTTDDANPKTKASETRKAFSASEDETVEFRIEHLRYHRRAEELAGSSEDALWTTAEIMALFKGEEAQR